MDVNAVAGGGEEGEEEKKEEDATARARQTGVALGLGHVCVRSLGQNLGDLCVRR